MWREIFLSQSSVCPLYRRCSFKGQWIKIMENVDNIMSWTCCCCLLVTAAFACCCCVSLNTECFIIIIKIVNVFVIFSCYTYLLVLLPLFYVEFLVSVVVIQVFENFLMVIYMLKNEKVKLVIESADSSTKQLMCYFLRKNNNKKIQINWDSFVLSK